MKCPHCNHPEWTRLDICPGVPVHDCSKFQEKPITEDEKRRIYLRQIERSPLVGDQLHFIIRKLLRQDITATCDCRKWIDRMNAWGPVGCRQRIDRIVRKLLVEARKRNMLESRVPGMKWVKRTGANPVARWMVRRAVRRAEKVPLIL
jgi:hypothetical protein